MRTSRHCDSHGHVPLSADSPSAGLDVTAGAPLGGKPLDGPLVARFHVLRDSVTGVLHRPESALRQPLRPVHHCVTPIRGLSYDRPALQVLRLGG